MLKKITLVLLALIIFFYGLAVGHYHIFPFNAVLAVKEWTSGNTSKTSSKYTAGYLNKKTFFEVNSQSDYSTVFIGDSLTDGADWYDIFSDHTIANRGISGDTTGGVLNRMDTIVNTNAENAIVMIGINDINSGINIETIIDNYTKILDELEVNNITPIVQSTLLTYDRPKEWNGKVKELNASLKYICSERNITYIDLNTHLSENGILNKKYSYDGVHLNGQGYLVWSKVISEYVK